MNLVTRVNYISHLRELADLLTANPELPLPYESRVVFYIHKDLREALNLRDLMTNPVTTRSTTSENFAIRISGTLANHPTYVYVDNKIALASKQPLAKVVPGLQIDGE